MNFDASTLDERLAPVSQQWKETPAAVPGELPPDGVYQAQVESFDFFESKRGELFMKTVCLVNAGDYAGAEASCVHSLERESGLPYTKAHLKTLGLEDPDRLIGLRERLARLIGTVVEIRVKTSADLDRDGNPYRNVYVNKRLGRADPDLPVDPVEYPEPDDPDDVPF